MAYYERLNIKDIFQEEVFTDEVMQRYMSEDAYRALKDVIARGDELPRSPVSYTHLTLPTSDLV